jgi:hypothetical protein
VRDTAKCGRSGACIGRLASIPLSKPPIGIRGFSTLAFIKQGYTKRIPHPPPGDINEQNTRMSEGERLQKDLERHVAEWIVKNVTKWIGWLAEARKAAQ